jgi:hypothetical protein
MDNRVGKLEANIENLGREMGEIKKTVKGLSSGISETNLNVKEILTKFDSTLPIMISDAVKTHEVERHRDEPTGTIKTEPGMVRTKDVVSMFGVVFKYLGPMIAAIIAATLAALAATGALPV